MSFPRYPEYKDSGVDWMGVIPSHWVVEKFRYLFTESGEKIEDDIVGEMLSVSGYRGIEIKQYEYDSAKRTEDELVGYRIVRSGQLVVNTMWLNYAGLGVSDYEGHVSPAYRSYWVSDDLKKRYVHHLMRSEFYVNGYKKYLTGIRPNSLQMSRDDMMSFPILVPSYREQQKIAAFLDHETAKIDALIDEQKRLIKLLKEKRQAVISHAVTKGLDPNVPMKDAGVEWLGEVPAHWNLAPFSYAIYFQEGPGILAVDFRDDGVPLLRISGLQGNWATLDGCNYLDPDKVRNKWSHFQLEKGDLVISASASMGVICEVGEEVKGAVPYTGLIRLKPRREFTTKNFVKTFLSSDLFFTQIDLLKAGSTIQHFGPTHLSQMKLLLPPISEQELIAKRVDSLSTEYEELIGEAERGIDMLQERRSALISAAVTGKIDVRDWRPPASGSTAKQSATEGAPA